MPRAHVSRVYLGLSRQVCKTFQMKFEAEVVTTCTGWFHPVSEQPEKLLQKSGRVQNEISIGSEATGS